MHFEECSLVFFIICLVLFTIITYSVLMKDNKTRVKKSIEGDGVGERSKIKDTFYFDYLLSIDNQIFWESICTSTVVHSSCEQAS